MKRRGSRKLAGDGEDMTIDEALTGAIAEGDVPGVVAAAATDRA